MNLSVGVNDQPGPFVLLVEDDTLVRDFLRDCLELLGCVVTPIEDGPQALAALQRGDFDLILSDLHVPGITSEDLLEQLKAVKPPVPLILITGSLEDLEQQSRALGARLIVKPVAVDALCTAVREALEPTSALSYSR
jgi:CheY-like chemotaxis protein